MVMKKILWWFLILSMILTVWWCVEKTNATESNTTSSKENSLEGSIYVDVREVSERNEGHVSGAIHLPLWKIESWQTDNLPKDKQLIVYCRSGSRSSIAIKALQAQWFTNLIDGGGMTRIKWAEIVR